jgi:plastocyanin
MKAVRIGAVAACVLLAAGVFASAPVRAAAHTVVIEGTAFVPSELVVKRGDRIVWINKDPFPHTVTAQDHSFDSGPIPPGKSWAHRARTQGSFPYGCTLHSTMKATLVVH